MDEVDGMSAGDRGGVGALNALIKKSKVRRKRIPLSFTFRFDSKLHFFRFQSSVSQTTAQLRS